MNSTDHHIHLLDPGRRPMGCKVGGIMVHLGTIAGSDRCSVRELVATRASRTPHEIRRDSPDAPVRIALTWLPPAGPETRAWSNNVIDFLRDTDAQDIALDLYTSSLGAAWIRYSLDILIDLDQMSIDGLRFIAPPIADGEADAGRWLGALADRLQWLPERHEALNDLLVQLGWSSTVQCDDARAARRMATANDPRDVTRGLTDRGWPAVVWAQHWLAGGDEALDRDGDAIAILQQALACLELFVTLREETAVPQGDDRWLSLLDAATAWSAPDARSACRTWGEACPWAPEWKKSVAVMHRAAARRLEQSPDNDTDEDRSIWHQRALVMDALAMGLDGGDATIEDADEASIVVVGEEPASDSDEEGRGDGLSNKINGDLSSIPIPIISTIRRT